MYKIVIMAMRGLMCREGLENEGGCLKALIGAFALCSLLAGCGGSSEDDLDRFMQDAGADMRGRVKPLPEVQSFTPVLFNAAGTLNDPFVPRKVIVAKSNGIQPDLDRPRETLEAFPLENLKFVGLIERGKVRFALINAPDGGVHQVTRGNYLGQNLGKVVELTDNEIKIKEQVQDELSGEWTERSASINLQE